MTTFVVDASAVAAWLLASQATEAADRLLAEWVEHRGYAPFHFPVEVRSFLLKAERRPGGTVGASAEKLALVASYHIAVAELLPDDELDEIMTLARRSGTTFTDALYLDLAAQLSATIATRDGGMVSGAQRLGLSVADLRPAEER